MNPRDPEITEWICDELDSIKNTRGLFEKQILWRYLQHTLMTLGNEMQLYRKTLIIVLRKILISKNQSRIFDNRRTRNNDCSG